MKDSPTYDPTQKYNFKLMAIADQAHYHIMIVDHMRQLGMAGIPERVQNFAGDSEAGARALSTIHQRVREFRAGVNAKDLPEQKTAAKPADGRKTATRPAATGRGTAKSTQSGDEATQEKSDMATAAKNGKATEATAEKHGKFPMTAKIALTTAGKTNPRREGTGPHKRYAVIMACNGQTVASFAKKKGASDTLARAVREKLVTVK